MHFLGSWLASAISALLPADAGMQQSHQSSFKLELHACMLHKQMQHCADNSTWTWSCGRTPWRPASFCNAISRCWHVARLPVLKLL